MRTFLEYFRLTAGMECSQLSSTFAYINLNENGFHRNYGSHAVSSHFRPQGLDFAIESCRSACFRSLEEFPLASDDRIPAGCFSFVLQAALDQY